jgi:hypothetical protein
VLRIGWLDSLGQVKSEDADVRSSGAYPLDRYHRELSKGRKVMPEMKVEKTGVVPASETVDSGVANPEDQNRAKSEDPLTKPAAGRLPARASRR